MPLAHRRAARLLAAGSVLMLAAATRLTAQPGLDTVQIRTLPVAQGVYLLRDPGGTSPSPSGTMPPCW